mmetsp:Transcript_99233/g.280828  ORF Transcript_99233/g.280828 Transcript_99233/m.280828 type:complete len:527 (-) Transcript_99233:520-2100(-)
MANATYSGQWANIVGQRGNVSLQIFLNGDSLPEVIKVNDAPLTNNVCTVSSTKHGYFRGEDLDGYIYQLHVSPDFASVNGYYSRGAKLFAGPGFQEGDGISGVVCFNRTGHLLPIVLKSDLSSHADCPCTSERLFKSKRANIGGHHDDFDISVRVDDTGPYAADVDGQELQDVLCTTDPQGHHHLFGKTPGGYLWQLHLSPNLRHVNGYYSRGSEPLAGPFSAEEVDLFGVVHGASPGPLLTPDPIVLGDDGTAAFRVMSFNVWKDGGRSLERTVEVIRTLRPDIVGLQEASEATVKRIARDVGLHYYALGRQGVLSRFPLECIFDDQYGGGVVAVHAPVEGRAEPFILRHANVHLEPYPYPPYELRAEGKSAGEAINVEATTQLPILAAVLSNLCHCSASPRPPLLLTGDFNCASHLDYGAEYLAPCSALCAAAGLVDTYAEANPTHLGAWRHGVHDAPGITWAALPEEEPKKIWDRIDFVYADRGSLAAVESSSTIDSRTAGCDPWPSDHRAVLSVLRLRVPPG